MKKCWHKSPDKRPSFSELAAEISGLLTNLAGYLTLETITGCTLPVIKVEDAGSESSVESLRSADWETEPGIVIHLTAAGEDEGAPATTDT